MAPPRTLTRLLQEWRNGDREALDAVMSATYDAMRLMARGLIRGERPGLTLDSVGLVAEVYQRFVNSGELQLDDRSHFLGIAARVMRQVLVDAARVRQAIRRGRAWVRVELNDDRDGGAAIDLDVIAVHEALEQLEALDPRLVRVVELRAFGGLTIRETAEALEVGTATVARDWRDAVAFMRSALRPVTA